MDLGTLAAEEAAPGGSMRPDLAGLEIVSLTSLVGVSGLTVTGLTSTGFDGSGTVAGKLSLTGATGARGGASTVLATEVVDDMAILLR